MKSNVSSDSTFFVHLCTAHGKLHHVFYDYTSILRSCGRLRVHAIVHIATMPMASCSHAISELLGVHVDKQSCQAG